MDTTAWAFYAFITAVALGAVALHYRLREPQGRGRVLLSALRGAALALLILLLFDPVVPAAGEDEGGTVLLLDGSLSMALPVEAGRTRWDAALEAARTTAADRILVFGGDAVARPDAADLGPGTTEDRGRSEPRVATPRATSSRLGPAVRAAAEAGAAQIIVVTDGGLEDAGEAARLAARSGLAVVVRRIEGGGAANAGIVEIEAPGWAEAGERVEVRVAVAAIGAVADSLRLTLRRDGRELARASVPAPAEGRLSTATLPFTPRAASAGPVRLDVLLEGTDDAPDDDVRSFYLQIGEEPAGVALVSFRPDQEPRFLLPVLERALGVPARGWLALPEGRYIRLGSGSEAGGIADEAAVRRAVSEADLVVLHAIGPDAPGWAREAAASADRALLFPAAATLEAAPFAPGPERPGDWYPAAEVPASPVAAMMAGLEPGDAPPLRALRTPTLPPAWWSPLNARLGRRGDARPVVAAGTEGGRRLAVALGEGYWRWGFSEGAGRATYDRLWSAVGGWLMAERRGALTQGVAPAARVVARGEPVRFAAPAGADSVRLRITPEGESPRAVDSVVAVVDGQAVAGVLPPGHYRFDARSYGPEGETATGEGPLTVESFSPEFTRSAVPLEALAGAESGREGARSGGGRPLRSSAWPYALLIGLLCVEWVLRRRWGLR